MMGSPFHPAESAYVCGRTGVDRCVCVTEGAGQCPRVHAGGAERG